jgi:hypothetical protein
MNKRSWIAIGLLIASLLIWLPGSELIPLIINNDEIVLGRYSRTHFGILLLLTLIFWMAAGVLFSTRRKPVAETLFALFMIYFSTGISAFALVIGSGLLNKPRYVEQKVSGVDADTGIALNGIVRHRPPKERFDLVQKDVPEQLRSYPDAPAGYPEFPVVLTTDANGFRNQQMLDEYDMLAIGDSFVAGSHVSDDQAWVDLLRKRLGKSIYNLGVSGSDLTVYFNNFISLGRKLQPKTVLVMLYEGNDFRDAPPLPKMAGNKKNTNTPAEPVDKTATIGFLAKSSPVTKGLRRLTGEVLAKVGRDNPVPGYAETVGFMPLAVDTPKGKQHYSFDPKRLRYLVDASEQDFAASSDWRNVRDALEQFVMLSKKDNFRLVIVYAPSAPHVIMPLVEDKIPAQQLLNFSQSKKKKIEIDAESYKKQVFSRLDAEENVWRNWCNETGVECVSTSLALRDAAAAGRQVYFTYDQHWTPEGNAVTADVLAHYLSVVSHLSGDN